MERNDRESTTENGFSGIREKNLRVVVKQIELLSGVHDEKSKLIKKLVHNKKKALKLTKDTTNSESDNEHNEAKILTLLEKEKNIVFNAGVNLDDQAKQSKQNVPHVTFPVIPRHKIDQMFNALDKKKKISIYERKLCDCLARIHTCANPPWNSPSVILKAVKDSVLRRKWENLAKLLLMLIHLPSKKYKPIIRHMCQILDKYHPVIRRTGLHNQFNVIESTYRGTTENVKLIV